MIYELGGGVQLDTGLRQQGYIIIKYTDTVAGEQVWTYDYKNIVGNPEGIQRLRGEIRRLKYILNKSQGSE